MLVPEHNHPSSSLPVVTKAIINNKKQKNTKTTKAATPALEPYQIKLKNHVLQENITLAINNSLQQHQQLQEQKQITQQIQLNQTIVDSNLPNGVLLMNAIINMSDITNAQAMEIDTAQSRNRMMNENRNKRKNDGSINASQKRHHVSNDIKLKIINDYTKLNLTQEQLAKKYAITSRSTVAAIIRNSKHYTELITHANINND
jgi:hypothetical protein